VRPRGSLFLTLSLYLSLSLTLSLTLSLSPLTLSHPLSPSYPLSHPHPLSLSDLAWQNRQTRLEPTGWCSTLYLRKEITYSIVPLDRRSSSCSRSVYIAVVGVGRGRKKTSVPTSRRQIFIVTNSGDPCSFRKRQETPALSQKPSPHMLAHILGIPCAPNSIVVVVIVYFTRGHGLSWGRCLQLP